ncbi:SCAN domain-containing protein 3 [Trichonephila clavipes]|nr:SCAN domain-containing protein 3 [Trichonephila clavipes]
MFGDNFAKELQSIPLSNDTVSRRIDDIAEDVEQQLFGKLRDKLFSIQLDEATDRNKDAHFIAYVRFWDGMSAITHKIHLDQLILQSAQYAYPYIIKLIYVGGKATEKYYLQLSQKKVDGVKHTSKFEGQRDDKQKYYSRGYKKRSKKSLIAGLQQKNKISFLFGFGIKDS